MLATVKRGGGTLLGDGIGKCSCLINGDSGKPSYKYSAFA